MDLATLQNAALVDEMTAAVSNFNTQSSDLAQATVSFKDHR
jgi:hypothetical protein